MSEKELKELHKQVADLEGIQHTMEWQLDENARTIAERNGRIRKLEERLRKIEVAAKRAEGKLHAAKATGSATHGTAARWLVEETIDLLTTALDEKEE